jgi:hypothetical protein
MPLFITKINSSSTTVSFNYLETEATWGILVSSSYEFNISDTSYTDGDDVLYEGIQALDQVYLNQNIVGKIGSNEIRNGLVTSISYPESPNVGRTTASISIEERQRVNSHGAIADIIQNIPSPQDVESFSERFSFERGQNSYSSSRDISLKYKQDAGHFFFDKARIFIQSMFFESRPNLGYQIDGISENARFNSNLKPLITETVDLLNKEISFSEKVSVNFINSENEFSDPYSENIKITYSIDDKGYKTKNYSANLKALKEPLEVNILTAIKLFIERISQENFAEFNYPISISRTINSDGGAASVSLGFSNDPSLNSITNAVYSASKAKSESWNTYTFNVNISSKGSNQNTAFNASKNFWLNNYDIGFEKIAFLFDINSNLYEVSRNTEFNKFEKTLTETVTYSDNPTYATNNNNLLKTKIDISDSLPIDRHEIKGILAEREILVKRANGKTLSTRNVSVELTGKDFSSLENSAISIAEAQTPQAAYFYISSKSTSYDPINGVSSASITFDYFN